MSTSTRRQRPGRRGYTSCDFCRTRKLRCDRPLPCTTCKARGKKCLFEGVCATSTTSSDHGQNTPASAGSTASTASGTPTSGFAPNPPLPAVPASSLPQGDLLAEIQAVRQLAQRLEKRFEEWRTSTSQGSSIVGPSPVAPTTSEDRLNPPTSLEQVGHVFAHLERFSMSQSSLDLMHSPDLVFNSMPIKNTPHALTHYTTQSGKLRQCVWFPLQSEASVLVNTYIQDLSYVQHVVHPQSLSMIIDEAYRQIRGQAPVQSGHLILLLSIIASATHIWGPQEGDDERNSLFVSSAQANAQTPQWIRSAYAVLDATRDCTVPTLETIQGIIILSFVVSNLEGFSMRFRSLISTGILLARELGLHQIDGASNTGVASSPFRVEMSRRVWWYLVATDWVLAVRYSGPCQGVYQAHPRHMTVNRPLNINDADMLPNRLPTESPRTEPTDMSYFLERLRLAEIARSIVDHSLMSTSFTHPSHYAQVMAVDFELEQWIRNMPPFFKLANHEYVSDASGANSIFIQAYMINSLAHTQRCKLHIVYLTSKSKDDQAYAVSRDICLRSAKEIIRMETQLLRSQHPFVRIRLRLAAILYSIFIANIIFLMDICAHRPASLQQELSNGDLAEALEVLKGARSHSLAAMKLFDSFMQVIASYSAVYSQIPATQTSSTSIGSPLVGLSHGLSSAASLIFSSMYTPYSHDSAPLSENSANSDNFGIRGDVQGGISTGSAVFTNSLPTLGVEDISSLDDIEWGDLFSDALSLSLI